MIAGARRRVLHPARIRAREFFLSALEMSADAALLAMGLCAMSVAGAIAAALLEAGP